MEKTISHNERTAVWLDSFDAITLKQKFLLLDYFVEPQRLFDDFTANADFIKAVVGDAIYSKMEYARNEDYIDRMIESYQNDGIGFVSRYNEKYSNLLRQIENPPLILYYKGDISLLNTFCIGMVGTRHCTHYGADCARKFSKELAENGMTIVSGLATGIDTYSHEGALVGGKTITVFAGGVDIVYPSANDFLAKQIEKEGLIVSEFKPHTTTKSYNFPLRNRIIAGLCRGILIVEASNKSGTMHTKEYALSENRDVFCIPGNITSPASQGTNRLIRNQEAICVTDPIDILNHYYITPKVRMEEAKKQFDGLMGQIYEILDVDINDFETLKTKTQADTKTLNQTLTKMEIKGIINKLAGNKYELKR